MNYDDRWDRIENRWLSYIRHPFSGSGFSEADCSPHPFDIMVIYALYQTAPRVSISGPTSGVELTTVQLRAAHVSNLTPPYTYEWTASWPNLTFTPNIKSESVSMALPDVDASDPAEQIRVIVEVKVNDANGRMGRGQHVITVDP